MTDLRSIPADNGGDVSPMMLSAPITVPDVVSRLAAIQTYAESHSEDGKHDGLACFNYLYHQVTARVLTWINEGEFANADFLTTLDLMFAGRYLDALRADATDPATAPRSWEALLENRGEDEISPMQFAVAGVNAHVNFDLPFAVVATCERLGTEPNFGTQRADYDKVNDIFAEEMESLRRHFEDRFARWFDEHVLGHFENMIGNFSVEKARATAWEQAEFLFELRKNHGTDQRFTESLDHLVGMAGHLLLVHL